MEARQQKFISYAWLALTLFYLFLRYQNIPGVFSDVGIITIDTDPYYRLHRIRSIIQSAWTYPLLDPSLNYPEGFSVAWPLGLDYLIAAPLKLLGIQNHSSIMITALLAMPIITLPILFLTGLVATQSAKNAWVGLGAGLFVTLMNVLLQQTAVGRLDHHGLEALFALLVLWFLAKIKQSDSNVLYWGFIVSMGLSPSFYPHAWVPVGCAAIVMSFESDSKFSQRVSLAMFICVCLKSHSSFFFGSFCQG
jgi:asparagine N-glycosylation enzyme membrane subunit Stt3